MLGDAERLGCRAPSTRSVGGLSSGGSGAAADDEGEEDADSGLGWPWVIGGLVVLAALALGLLAALRRRRGRSTQSPAPDLLGQ